MVKGTIYEINGPVVKVRDVKGFSISELVKVGNEKLIGEVIGIDGESTIIQVYEATSGIKPGEPVIGEGMPLSVTLAPGIISGIFDGIERPLDRIAEKNGAFIARGVDVDQLDMEKKWEAHITVKAGDKVTGGAVIAEVKESELITHRAMIPPGMEGTVVEAKPDGSYTICEPIIKVKTEKGEMLDVPMMQKWPIRQGRPYAVRRPIERLLMTGQRVIDTLFPIAKGGTAAIPGSFGTGKTMTQHQLAKWCDADIIVYIGCGERGNEMTQVLEEFTKLVDPKSGRSLMERTIIIANTSNMPVAAREASIYTGITFAEYYRDMGYDVAIMADSTSRWAEALREISGRLEEMPAEEGYPAYLPSRLAQFYERAGLVDNLNGSKGSVSIIGAVSPQGGDFSEPVTQNTKRFIRCFWSLDRSLAYSRHYPAIGWITSYSEYFDELESWYEQNVGEDFPEYRRRFIELLQEENDLMEIVKLIGSDVLPDSQRLTLEIARVIRVGYLQQNAFHKDDTYVPLKKQYRMMQVILHLYDEAKKLIDLSMPISRLRDTGIFEKIIAIKYDVTNDHIEKLEEYDREVDSVCERLRQEYQS